MLPSLFTFRRKLLAIRKIIKNRILINSWITVIHQKPVKHECINPGCQDVISTKFRTMVSNICGYSVWNAFHITLRAPKILRWLLHIRKMCATLLENRSTSHRIPPPYAESERSPPCMGPLLRQVYPVHIHSCLTATVITISYLLPRLASGHSFGIYDYI